MSSKLTNIRSIILLQPLHQFNHLVKFLTNSPHLILAQPTPPLHQRISLNKLHIKKTLVTIFLPPVDFRNRYAALQFLANHYLSLSFDPCYISAIFNHQTQRWDYDWGWAVEACGGGFVGCDVEGSDFGGWGKG